MRRPRYFDFIQKETRSRWDQLEADVHLAAPWRQLFRQIKSPRHVLSELLQNADDAGATMARATLAEGIFRFEHDGTDFDEASFRSLCSFGFSNKRHLQTIGFRGLGFKSTFSLGRRVELYTPTLAVAFDEARFTEPVWIENAPATELTQIVIKITRPELEEQVRANFQQWVASPIPLLFFRKITQLQIQDQTITRQRLKRGPVRNSEWVRVSSGTGSQQLLRITSPEVNFPAEALEEVRSERGDADFELPPCRVEIVVGQAKQRLYVVLPTEVRPTLPFSANAPFIQDPARTGIKELSLSPTNRWLLDRVGRLASKSMLEWLANTNLDLEERAQAYGLLPAVTVGNGGMDQDSAEAVAKAFVDEVGSQPMLLTSEGGLAKRSLCLGLPAELLDIWAVPQTLGVFGTGQTQILAREVNVRVREILRLRGWLGIISPENVTDTLSKPPRPPRPESLDGVARLWAYIENHAPPGFWWGPQQRQLRIVPVRGRPELAGVEEVLVLGERDGNLAPDDWDFLIARVNLVDADWVERVSQAEDAARRAGTSDLLYAVAGRLFRRLRLDRRVGLPQIVEAVAKPIFAAPRINRADAIRLAQVAARGGVSISSEVFFQCRDGEWRQTRDGLLIELQSELESLLPSAWVSKHLLHADYTGGFGPNDWDTWRRWAQQNDLGLFPLPAQTKTGIHGYEAAQAAARAHGYQEQLEYPRRSRRFELEDYDFDSYLWAHWERLGRTAPDTWGRVMRGIVQAASAAWRQRSHAQLRQLSGQSTYMVAEGKLPAKWLLRLRDLTCLPDMQGNWRLPSQLMRTTPETAPLQNIESFVRADYDLQASQWLLDLLGVRNTPDNAEKLLGRLRALAQPETLPPRLYVELVDLYRALDRVLPRLETDELAAVRTAFADERLIRAEDGTWQKAGGIFQRNDDEIPGVALVLTPVADLTLWGRLGVPPHPTLDKVLDWLESLPHGQRLEEGDRKRVRQMLGRVPRQAWQRGGWLDLNGRWTQVSDLRYYTLNSGVERGLFTAVRQATADFTMLPDDAADWALSVGLLSLEANLHQRLEKADPTPGQRRPEWLAELGRCLFKVKPALPPGDDAAVATWQANRDLARNLGRSRWQPVRRLEVMPYVDGTPAGDARPVKAAWVDETIYVMASGPSHHRELAAALAAPFRGQGLAQAIADCIDRPASWVADYFAANFELFEPEAEPEPEDERPEALAEPETQDAPIPQPTEAEAQLPMTPANGEAPAGVSDAQVIDATPIMTPAPALEVGEDGHEPEPEAEDEVAETGEEEEVGTSVAAPRPRAPSTFERLAEFMQRLGFHWDAARDLFADVRGNVIRREEGVLKWVIYDQNGQRRDGYWIGNRSLEQGLEISGGDWETLKRAPDSTWLLLPEESGELRSLQMRRLMRRVQSGEVGLYPAMFRLRLEAVREAS